MFFFNLNLPFQSFIRASFLFVALYLFYFEAGLARRAHGVCEAWITCLSALVWLCGGCTLLLFSLDLADPHVHVTQQGGRHPPPSPLKWLQT